MGVVLSKNELLQLRPVLTLGETVPNRPSAILLLPATATIFGPAGREDS